MSLQQPAIAMAAAALFAVVGSTAVSAQQNCGFMYQRVMEAYQTQAPYYGQMLNHYNERCLSGGSSQPVWEAVTTTTAGVGAGNRAPVERHSWSKRAVLGMADPLRW
jgi:hypothetical protein